MVLAERKKEKKKWYAFVCSKLFSKTLSKKGEEGANYFALVLYVCLLTFSVKAFQLHLFHFTLNVEKRTILKQ